MTDQSEPEDADSLVHELLDACNDPTNQKAILSELTGDETALPVVGFSQAGWKEIIPRVIPKPTAEQSRKVAEYLLERNIDGEEPGQPLDESSF